MITESRLPAWSLLTTSVVVISLFDVPGLSYPFRVSFSIKPFNIKPISIQLQA
ncbi:hypothetical protein [Cyanobium sp. LEGE 06113]|uniref:hypothetical protein n=1 Tax=Cyanobium sp. LEGE 06113 TaxID=1297573 RepID=UPI001882653D|nr:hypothetical protein [Cyanobium sp. LEGE 06113]MBE9154148.1 hypothetical protein [Cyanobium sp. LEGE 06113]